MKDYWIDPAGKLHECVSHDRFAATYLEDKLDVEPFAPYPYQQLHNLGWIRVSKNMYPEGLRIEIMGDCIDLTRPIRNTMGPAMNERQIKTAKMLCAEHNYDLHKALNDKRFLVMTTIRDMNEIGTRFLLHKAIERSIQSQNVPAMQEWELVEKGAYSSICKRVGVLGDYRWLNNDSEITIL